MSDTQCCASTTKRAWDNPLAPRDRCKKKRLPGKEYCAVHQKKADSRVANGWSADSMRSQFAPKK